MRDGLIDVVASDLQSVRARTGRPVIARRCEPATGVIVASCRSTRWFDRPNYGRDPRFPP